MYERVLTLLVPILLLTTSAGKPRPEPVFEVVLHPGDVLYHPAGMWHKVECLEDSVAINISVVAYSCVEHLAAFLLELKHQIAQP